jgi:hypothetical protein
MTEQPEAGGDAGTTWANGLESEIVWREFAAVAAIPRRSKQERLVAHMCWTASRSSVWWRRPIRRAM